MRRLNRISCIWSPELAYAIGVITTDGNLSRDGRHLCIVSKDRDMILTMRHLLGINNMIGKKARGGSMEKKYYVLQFGDKTFYEFLLSVGLTPAKSKTLSRLNIPSALFHDFLRGCIDGDGSIGSYTHPESKHLQIKLQLCSASPPFLAWILTSIQELYKIKGGSIYQPKTKSTASLSFGKKDSLELLHLMYYSKTVPALHRKRRVVQKLMGE